MRTGGQLKVEHAMQEPAVEIRIDPRAGDLDHLAIDIDFEAVRRGIIPPGLVVDVIGAHAIVVGELVSAGFGDGEGLLDAVLISGHAVKFDNRVPDHVSSAVIAGLDLDVTGICGRRPARNRRVVIGADLAGVGVVLEPAVDDNLVAEHARGKLRQLLSGETGIDLLQRDVIDRRAGTVVCRSDAEVVFDQGDGVAARGQLQVDGKGLAPGQEVAGDIGTADLHHHTVDEDVEGVGRLGKSRHRRRGSSVAEIVVERQAIGSGLGDRDRLLDAFHVAVGGSVVAVEFEDGVANRVVGAVAALLKFHAAGANGIPAVEIGAGEAPDARSGRGPGMILEAAVDDQFRAERISDFIVLNGAEAVGYISVVVEASVDAGDLLTSGDSDRVGLAELVVRPAVEDIAVDRIVRSDVAGDEFQPGGVEEPDAVLRVGLKPAEGVVAVRVGDGLADHGVDTVDHAPELHCLTGDARIAIVVDGVAVAVGEEMAGDRAGGAAFDASVDIGQLLTGREADGGRLPDGIVDPAVDGIAVDGVVAGIVGDKGLPGGVEETNPVVRIGGEIGKGVIAVRVGGGFLHAGPVAVDRLPELNGRALDRGIVVVEVVAVRVAEEVAGDRAERGSVIRLVQNLNGQRLFLDEAASGHDADDHIIAVGAFGRHRIFPVGVKDEAEQAGHGVDREQSRIRAAGDLEGQLGAVRAVEIDIEYGLRPFVGIEDAVAGNVAEQGSCGHSHNPQMGRVGNPGT